MPIEYWERIQEIFLSVVDLPCDERARVMNAQCRGDAGLRTEVESLLASDSGSEATLITEVRKEAAQFLDSHPLIGERLFADQIERKMRRGAGSV